MTECNMRKQEKSGTPPRLHQRDLVIKGTLKELIESGVRRGAPKAERKEIISM